MSKTRALALFAALVAAIAAGCSRANPLLAPRPALVAAPAPDSFLVLVQTTRGDVLLKARRNWAPLGVDRFYYLARNGFYDGARFFRVLPGFVAQFGIPADPAVAAVWRERGLPDDRPSASNRRGTVSFAHGGPGTRTTQLFINLRDNSRLDTLGGVGFPPIGEVVQGMHVVDSLHAGYGEGPPRGTGPAQDSIRLQGNSYLDRGFPRLDAIRSVRVITEWNRAQRTGSD
ncbi:MAG TPA: peptidylprolyl isomerase [Gemmatimonadaceae bacterium]|nr:peptidylprolyl isomerase [Gemmatimonadaceae bacterium]